MPEQTFVHMELAGACERVLGFIDGLRLAAGADHPVWYHSEQGYALDSVIDSMREKMGLETHVVLTRELAETVRSCLERSEVVQARVVWIKEIDYAELDFDFRCFSRDVGAEVRAVVESDLPAGLRLESYSVDESVSDEAKGVELYSPVHDYTLTGSGRYVGPVPAVFEIARRLHDQDFIEPGRVHFHHAG